MSGAADDFDPLGDGQNRFERLGADRTDAGDERAALRLRTGRDVYGVPRRFDLATIFAITVAYALLFGLMRAFLGFVQFASDSPRADFEPARRTLAIVTVCVAAYLTIIGVGQVVLFRGQKPRAASIATGIFVFLCGLVVIEIFQGTFLVPGVIASILGGVITGYAGGGVVAGVFLVADLIRRHLPHRQRATADEDADEP
jgi:hypothetical protein